MDIHQARKHAIDILTMRTDDGAMVDCISEYIQHMVRDAELASGIAAKNRERERANAMLKSAASIINNCILCTGGEGVIGWEV